MERSPEIAIGAEVRVRVGGSARRAIVATIDGDTVDVIFRDSAEARAAVGDLSPLEPFERSPPLTDADALKSQGNTLYGLKDFEAAAERYEAAIKAMRKGCTLSEGQKVLVISPEEKSRPVRPAIVATLVDADVEVVFVDDDGIDTDGDAVLPQSKLVTVAEPTELHIALYLNLARATFERGDRLPPIAYAHRALAAARHLDSADESRRWRLKALALLCKAEANRSNFKEARRLAQLGKADSHDGDWDRVLREVDRKAEAFRKSNKRIAREMTRWIDGVMTEEDNGRREEAPDGGGAGVVEARTTSQAAKTPGLGFSFLGVVLAVLVALLLGPGTRIFL